MMNEKKQIFISHATKDDKVVDTIAKILTDAGHTVWVDHQHLKIGSPSWDKAIKDAIQKCDVGLFVMTNTSLKSTVCRAECLLVQTLNKPLYVIRAEDVDFKDIWLNIRLIQYTNYVAHKGKSLFELLHAMSSEAGVDLSSKKLTDTQQTNKPDQPTNQNKSIKISRQKHIFVSYSHDDKAWTYEFAKALREDLEFSVFIDYKSIYMGANWWRKICENIESCDYVIYIMSPKATDSIYCISEIKYAVALNKPIFPIMIKPCTYPQILEERLVQRLLLSDTMQIEHILIALLKGLLYICELMFEGEYKLPNPLPPRPNEPEPKDIESSEKLYFSVFDNIQNNDFDKAIELLQQLIDKDKGEWGELAQRRLNETKSYQTIARLAKHSQRDARVLWQKHTEKFGADFDPLGFSKQLGQSSE